jgi:hypothetical protein
MLHIATVHVDSPRWIEIQTRHLREHLSVPYRTWASIAHIDPSYAVHFDRVVEQAGMHAGKLNHLAQEIAHEASDEDLLMFLDGDAFPIADPMPLIDESLARAPLMAVRRAENLGDLQPHPCFCVTTVGTWRRLPGDWSAGYKWLNAKGWSTSDVGANLLRQLELTETPWVEVLRSNRRELDPIFFSIYGDVVYHHGGGFRAGELTRAHLALLAESAAGPSPGVMSNPLGRQLGRARRRYQKLVTKRRQQRDSRRLLAGIAAGGTAWLAELGFEPEAPGSPANAGSASVSR